MTMFGDHIHPVRKKFRVVLLGFLGLSLLFLAVVIGMRVHYRDKPVEGALQTAMFEFDVLQHQTAAYFSNDADDMIIANRLLQLGLFSPLYTQAGFKMLEEKADAGYKPAIHRLSMLEKQAYYP